MKATVAHFREETADIIALMERGLSQHGPDLFAHVTRFKQWTVGDIFRHLHIWNVAAHDSLVAPERFRAFAAAALPVIAEHGHQYFQREHFKSPHPEEPASAGVSKDDAQVFADWQAYLPAMCADFAATDPDARVEWAGPPMSARSSLIARQMEHWAHTQAVYDLMGEARTNTDRLHAIAELGIRTYSFSHKIRGLEPPRLKPYVRLVASSGAVWKWNEPQGDNRVEGSAEAFCQTVTQCRNVADTDLMCVGEVAKRWMQNAQCFAGAAEAPPGVGERN